MLKGRLELSGFAKGPHRKEHTELNTMQACGPGNERSGSAPRQEQHRNVCKVSQ